MAGLHNHDYGRPNNVVIIIKILEIRSIELIILMRIIGIMLCLGL